MPQPIIFTLAGPMPAGGGTAPLRGLTPVPSLYQRASALKDNFDDNTTDTTKWNVTGWVIGGGVTGGTVAETNARLEITPVTNTGGLTFDGYVSVNKYDLTGDAIYATVSNITTIGSSQSLYIGAGQDTNNYYAIVTDSNSGIIKLQKYIGGVGTAAGSVTYSATTHARWRLRHDAPTDTINFDTATSTSSDPPLESEWTNRISVARDPAFSTNNLYLFLQNGTYTNDPAPVTVRYDGFNTGTAATTSTAITPADAAQSHAATSPTLATNYTITPDAAAQSHTATSPTLATNNSVTPNNAAQSQTATSPSITPVVPVNDAAQSQTATSPTLATNNTVAPNNAAQSQTATSSTVASYFAVNDAAHGHTAATATVSSADKAFKIAWVAFDVPNIAAYAANAAQGHTSTSPNVITTRQMKIAWVGFDVPTPAITAANAAQAHAATAPTVSVKFVLTLANAAQGQTSTAPTLAPKSTIAPNPAAQAHAANSPSIAVPPQTGIENATHPHAATSPGVAFKSTLGVQDAAQGHSATTATAVVTAHWSVAANDNAHGHSSTAARLTFHSSQWQDEQGEDDNWNEESRGGDGWVRVARTAGGWS